MTAPSETAREGRPQIWMHLFPVPRMCASAAARAEELGFDGVLLADSQNLVGDPFVELGVLARETTRLGLGTGIVNPVTRHPAVIAAAIASVHAESGGRAVLGMGRGDSSLAQLGLPTSTGQRFEQVVGQVRGYLNGHEVNVDGATSRIGWIAEEPLPPVAVEVAATGPRTIGFAAVHADRVMLTVGAEVDRIAWGIESARSARVTAGLDPVTLKVGAYLNVGCHDDVAVAAQLVRGSAAVFAHFSSLSRAAGSALKPADAAVVDQLGTSYDEARHGLGTAGHVSALDDKFVDRFAVIGSPRRCTARLRELLGLGLDRIVVVAGSRDTDPTLLEETNARFGTEVLPGLR
ncbi:MAG: hypothetical protein JWM76_87 [Pseudonocardiales bacterium]|nr:hypothetical protein [Pseudonocardiales bacterium]